MDDQDKSDAYQRGFTAGYQRRCQEEIETWNVALEQGRHIYDSVIRSLAEAPTYAERREARLAVLREAHAAELHAGRRVPGCPVCEEAIRAAMADVAALRIFCPLHEVGDPDNDTIVARWNRGVTCSAGDRCRARGLAGSFAERGPVPAHNGHYGVPENDVSVVLDGSPSQGCLVVKPGAQNQLRGLWPAAGR
jgi:hypothetical protein